MAPVIPDELRRRPKHARYSQRQLDRAFEGELHRGNTPKGSAARSAIYRTEAVARIARAEKRGLSRGQARGHPRRGEVRISGIEVQWSDVPTTEGMRDLVTSTPRQHSRVGLYLADIHRLLHFNLTELDFEERWRNRAREAGGYELEPDAGRVLALVLFSGPPPVDRYRRISAEAPS
ncbi:MAG: hypothetical protein WB565_10975 [Acidimicrobiales bacterium]